MKWPLSRRRTPCDEAQEAVERSQKALDEARAQTPVIRALAAQLREARQENHFAERVRQALEGQ